MSDLGKLPQTGDSQDIGDDADTCFAARKPRLWRIRNLGGTDDYGLDYQVQTTPYQQATDVFRVQLKGTTSPNTNVTDQYISIQFKASTVRYYARMVEPLLLVVCDLSVDPENPVDCPLYYVWAREELRRIDVEKLPADQDYVNLRFPKENRLTRASDLSEDIRRANELSKVGEAFNMKVSIEKPGLGTEDRLTFVHGVEKGVTGRSVAFIDALAEPPREHWVEPANGTLAWHLRATTNLLRSGKIDKGAAELENALPLLTAGTDLEKSDYWFLAGRIKSMQHDDTGARDAYWQAAQLNNQPKFWSGWAEAELRRRYKIDGENDFDDVIDRLPGEDPVILAIKARLLSAARKYDAAISLLDTFSGTESLAARVVVETMEGKPEKALNACIDGLQQTDLTPSNRQLFLLMKARARFTIAVGPKHLAEPGKLIPPSGRPGMDIETLKLAWADIQDAVEVMSDSGWSTNAEFLADIWAATASMLGKQKETLPMLAAAAKLRPEIEGLQSATEALAAQCGDFATATEANDRLPVDDTKILRQASFLHERRKHRDCVALMQAHVATLDHGHQLFGIVLALAALSAHILAKTELLQEWSTILDSEESLIPQRAVLDYLIATSDNKLGNEAAIAALEVRYRALGRPPSIALVLFQELDASDTDQAKKIIEAASRVKETIVLSSHAAIQLGMALVTEKGWDDLLELCKEFKNQFEASPRLTAFEGLALDRLGRTAEARTVLEELLEKGISDSVALKTYVNIMVRCGFVDEAIEAAERILEGASKPGQKMDCVRLLFNLIQTSDPASPRLIKLAVRMGELVDRADEVQEGVYLTMVLTGTMSAAVDITPDELAEFRARGEAFFAKWPDSKVLRKGETSPDASADEILRMIKSIVGESEKQLEFQRKLENQLQQGTVPVPFAWRPQHALSNIHDVVQLWEAAKRSGGDDRKYHLTMTINDWKHTPTVELLRKIPLLDLTSLLVLSDLDLLGRLFILFPKIAIPQSTLQELSRLTHTMSGSPWRGRCQELQQDLKSYLSQILQPSVEPNDEEVEKDGFSKTTEDIRTLCASGAYQLYSDDAIFRLYCAGADGTPQGICTLDVINGMEEKNLLTAVEAAHLVSKLCSWHVGVHILFRYQIAILPDGLVSAKDVQAGISLLQGTPSYIAMATAMWDVRADIQKLVEHMASTIRRLIVEINLSDIGIASIVGVWYLKVKLRDDATSPSISIIANTLALAAAPPPPLSETASKRMWSALLAMVELDYGKLMDEDREKEAIQLMAKLCAEFDAEAPGLPESFKNRFFKGLTRDTSPSDIFSEAYTETAIQIRLQALKRQVGSNG